MVKGKFLRFVVDKGGTKIDEDKTKAILAMELPQNFKSLRSFIGKVSYLRRFVPDWACIIKPLHQLTRKDAKFVWGANQEQAFQKIKQLLVDL